MVVRLRSVEEEWHRSQVNRRENSGAAARSWLNDPCALSEREIGALVMFCKKSLPSLLLLLGCPACGSSNDTSPEIEGVAAIPLSGSAMKAACDQTNELMGYTEEGAISFPECDPMDGAEVTGSVEQEYIEGPTIGNPWGDGGPDSHTYTGGPGGRARGGYADPRNYHRGSSIGDIERARAASRRYELGQKKKRQIEKAFARFQSEARSGRHERTGGGGSVNHEACAWTCDLAIAESCAAIQALCAGTPVILLSPHLSVSCSAAIFTACIAGAISSPILCDTLVCASVR